MFAKDLATIQKLKSIDDNERRSKVRFPMRREMRYQLVKDGAPTESGAGETIDMCSGGISFSIGHELPVGAFIELSMSWPVLLDQSCPMRLNVFGRIVRNAGERCACTIDKYEFRTQARVFQSGPVRHDSMLQRWADAVRKDTVLPFKTRSMTA